MVAGAGASYVDGVLTDPFVGAQNFSKLGVTSAGSIRIEFLYCGRDWTFLHAMVPLKKMSQFNCDFLPKCKYKVLDKEQ